MIVEHIERRFSISRAKLTEIVARHLGFDTNSKDAEIFIEAVTREDHYLTLFVRTESTREDETGGKSDVDSKH